MTTRGAPRRNARFDGAILATARATRFDPLMIASFFQSAIRRVEG
jgi:hypothetical protein